MRASPLEFRLRVLIIAFLLLLGMWSPGFRTHTLWSVLSERLASYVGGMLTASWLVIGFAALMALLSALLRTWATAYIGSGVVHDRTLHDDRVVAAGPYRFVRNPLYLGAEMNFIALAFLMPWWSGIAVALLLALFQLRLIFAEEHALAETPGYAAYKAAVPRLLPALTPRTAASTAVPHWGQSFLGELYFWGAAVSFLCCAASFNTGTILKWVGVSFGVSIIVRALGGKSLG